MADLLTLAMLARVDYCIIIVYLLLVVLIGFASARKQFSDRDYFLGGGNMPTWAVSLSVLATSLSAATFVGVPQFSFSADLSYLILIPGGLIAVSIVAFFFIPAFYRAGTLTIYGLLEKRFGSDASYAVSITFLIGRLLASGARLFIAAIPVTLILFGVEGITVKHTVLAVIILGLVGTAYTLMGGIRAVIWTDVLQFFILLGAGILTMVLLFRDIPLPPAEIAEVLTHGGEFVENKLNIVSTSTNIGASYTVWTGFFAIVFLNMASYGVDHDLVQRMLTCSSPLRGGMALIVSNLLGIPVVFLFLIIGLLLYVYYSLPEVMGDARPMDMIEGSVQIFPQYILNHLPPGAKGLAMAGIFAAAMSSFDSAVNAMAASFIADVQPHLGEKLRNFIRITAKAEEASPKIESASVINKSDSLSEEGHKEIGITSSRITVLGMGLLLTLFACVAAVTYDPDRDTLIGFALGVMSYAYAGMLGVFLTALFTRRGNSSTVICALCVGAGVVLLLQPSIFGRLTYKYFGMVYNVAFPWWMVLGTTASFIVCVLGKPMDNKEQSTS